MFWTDYVLSSLFPDTPQFPPDLWNWIILLTTSVALLGFIYPLEAQSRATYIPLQKNTVAPASGSAVSISPLAVSIPQGLPQDNQYQMIH